MEGRLTLNLLPSDLLVEIFAPRNISPLVIQLWKCGDSKLNGNLARSITCIDLVDTRFSSTSRWPKMLSSLNNLRSLSISRGSYWLLGSSEALIAQLKQLNALKLEKLEISSAEHFCELLSSARYPDPSLFDLSVHFPRLTLLSLLTPNENPIQPFTLPNLPQTLIRLSLPRISLSPQTEDIFSLLPKSLETFSSQFVFNLPTTDETLNANSIAVDPFSELRRIFGNAPPGLRELSHFDCSALPSKRLDWLPQSLEQVHASHVVDSSAESLTSLPIGLKNLVLSEYGPIGGLPHEVWVPQLPQRLQSLVIISSANIRFSASDIPNLPRSLKMFGIETYVASAALLNWTQLREIVSPSPLWPPGLAVLHIPKATVLIRDLDLLPPSLTSLICHWTEPSFPIRKGLRLLSLSLTLTDFRLRSTIDWNSSTLALQNDDDKLDDEIVSSFHTFIINFDLRNFADHPLPSKLKKLCLVSWKFHSLSLLPRTLTYFQCHYWEQMPTGNQTKAGDLFAELPCGLKILVLHGEGGDSMPLYSSVSFASLPQLTTLRLRNFVWFDPGVLKTLSTTALRLRTLRISVLSLNEENVRFIPQTLHQFELCLRYRENEILAQEFWPPDATDSRHPRQLNEYKERAAKYPDPRVLEAPFENRT